MSNLYNEPVKNTCPTIDKLIHSIDEAKRILKHLKDNDVKIYSLHDDLTEAYSEIEDLESKLEELRDANSVLRYWGRDLIDQCKKLESDLEKKELEIERIQATLSEYL